MSTVSLTLPSDGQTIDASDVNTPFNELASVINGNIDSNNIATGGVTPNALTSGTGTTWTWQTWTPTISSASGTITTSSVTSARYKQIGTTLFFNLRISITTVGTAGGSVLATLPATINTSGALYIATGREEGGTGKMLQGKIAVVGGSPTIAIFSYDNVFPASNGSSLNMTGFYEVA